MFNKQFISCALKFCYFSEDFINDSTPCISGCQRSDGLPENVKFPDTTKELFHRPQMHQYTHYDITKHWLTDNQRQSKCTPSKPCMMEKAATHQFLATNSCCLSVNGGLFNQSLAT